VAQVIECLKAIHSQSEGGRSYLSNEEERGTSAWFSNKSGCTFLKEAVTERQKPALSTGRKNIKVLGRGEKNKEHQTPSI